MQKVLVRGIGNIYFPDEMSPDDISRAIENEILPYHKSPTAGVGEAAIGSTKRGISSAFTALTAPFSSEAPAAGVARQEAIKERPGFNWDEIKRTYADEGIIPAIGETLHQVPGAIAEQAPILGSVMAGGALGGMYGGAPGAIVGGLVYPTLQMMGSNIERQQQETPGDVNLPAAYAAGLGQGALESVGGPTSMLLRRMAGRQAAEQVLEAPIKQSFKSNMLEGTGKALAGEVPVEVAQQALERGQAGMPLGGADALDEYLASAMGAALSSPIGGPIHHMQNRADVARYEDQQAQIAQEQAAAEAERARIESMGPQMTIPGMEMPDTTTASETAVPSENPLERVVNHLRDAAAQHETPEKAFSNPAQVKNYLLQNPDVAEGLSPKVKPGDIHAAYKKSLASSPLERAPTQADIFGQNNIVEPTIRTPSAAPSIAPKSTQDIIEERTGIVREPTLRSANTKAFKEDMDAPSGIWVKDPETQQERQLSNWENMQRRIPPENIVEPTTENIVEPTVVPPFVAPSNIITAATLKGLGLRSGTSLYKKLLGLDLTKPEGYAIFKSLPEQTKAKVNESLYDELISKHAPLEESNGETAANNGTDSTGLQPPVDGQTDIQEPSTGGAPITNNGPLDASELDAGSLTGGEEQRDPTLIQDQQEDDATEEPTSQVQPVPSNAGTNQARNEKAATSSNEQPVVQKPTISPEEIKRLRAGLEARAAQDIAEQEGVAPEKFHNTGESIFGAIQGLFEEYAQHRKDVVQAELAEGGYDVKLRKQHNRAQALLASLIDSYGPLYQQARASLDSATSVRSIDKADSNIQSGLADYIRQSRVKRQTAENEANRANWHNSKFKKYLKESGKPTSEAIKQLVVKNNLTGLINHIALQVKDPTVRKLIQNIAKMKLATKIVVGDTGANAGVYDSATDTITLHPENGLNEHAALHEVVHAAVSHILDKADHPVTKQFSGFFEQIKNDLGSSYGGTNLQEFASELMSNPEFQGRLQDMQAPSGQSMLARIAQAILNFFGIGKRASAFDTALGFMQDIIASAPTVPRDARVTLALGSERAAVQAREDIEGIIDGINKVPSNLMDSVKDFWSNLKDGKGQKWFMDALNMQNMADILKNREGLDPSVKAASEQVSHLITELSTLIDRRAGNISQRVNDTSKKYKKFVKAYRKHPGQFQAMSKMAIEARLEQVNPLKGATYKANAANPTAYNKVLAQYNALHTDVQEAYKTIRADFDKAYFEYRDYLYKTFEGNPTMLEKLKEKFETGHVESWVPFNRYGENVLEYTDPDGDRVVQQFESKAKLAEFVAKELSPKNIKFETYDRYDKVTYNADSVAAASLIGQVMHKLKLNGASQEQLNEIYQIHLSMFPAGSIAKHFMKAEGVSGMDTDIVRNYADTMVTWDRKLANTLYMGPINDTFKAIETAGDKTPDAMVHAAVQSMIDRQQFVRNPVHPQWSNTMAALNYQMFIAGNLSSAFVNLTALPIMVYPVLGSKFGMSQTFDAMNRAGKLAMNDWGKNPKYAALFKDMEDRNQLSHNMYSEILQGRHASTDTHTGVVAHVANLLSIPFSASEKYNRAVTAIAAYDLAKAKHNMSEAEAIDFAINTVKDIHTSGMATSASRYSQTHLGRVFLTFKNFAWNSAYIVARAFHQAARSESKEVREIARKQLLGIYALSGAFGGIAGLPFYSLGTSVASILQAMMGDDEPFDPEEELRMGIGQVLGGNVAKEEMRQLGELAIHGPTNAISNLNISSRTSVANDLLFRDNPRNLEKYGPVATAMMSMFGPAGGYALSVGDAYELSKNGHDMRALEMILPSWMKNTLKGARFSAEGAQTLKGDYIQKDISTWNSLMQVVGFSPADLMEKQNVRASAKRYETKINEERGRLLSFYDMATRAGDNDAIAEVQEKINGFNSRHPGDRITGDTIARSRRSRLANDRYTMYGLAFNKRLAPEIAAKYGDSLFGRQDEEE